MTGSRILEVLDLDAAPVHPPNKHQKIHRHRLPCSSSPPPAPTWIRPPPSATTAAASIWGASTVPYRSPGHHGVLRRSSSDRVDGALQSTSHNGVPHFLLYMQYTVIAKGRVLH